MLSRHPGGIDATATRISMRKLQSRKTGYFYGYTHSIAAFVGRLGPAQAQVGCSALSASSTLLSQPLTEVAMHTTGAALYYVTARVCHFVAFAAMCVRLPRGALAMHACECRALANGRTGSGCRCSRLRAAPWLCRVHLS